MISEISPSWEINKTGDVLYFIHSSGRMITISSHIDEFIRIIQYIEETRNINVSFISKNIRIKKDIVASAISFLEQNSIIVKNNLQLFETVFTTRLHTVQSPFIYFLQDKYCKNNENDIEYKYINGINKRITFIGLGATGSLTAQLMVSAGFRNLRLVDGDHVELKNLGRQFIYHEDDIGKSKAKVLQEKLLSYDTEVSVQIIDKYIKGNISAMEAVKDSDFVLLTADKPKLKIQRWIDYACKQLKIPYLRTMYNQLGPIYVPGQTPCFNCLEEYWKLKYLNYKDVVKSKSILRNKTLPASPFGVTSAASFYAEEIFNFLTGIEQAQSMEGILVFRNNTMELQRIPFSKKCNCNVNRKYNITP